MRTRESVYLTVVGTVLRTVVKVLGGVLGIGPVVAGPVKAFTTIPPVLLHMKTASRKKFLYQYVPNALVVILKYVSRTLICAALATKAYLSFYSILNPVFGGFRLFVPYSLITLNAFFLLVCIPIYFQAP